MVEKGYQAQGETGPKRPPIGGSSRIAFTPTDMEAKVAEAKAGFDEIIRFHGKDMEAEAQAFVARLVTLAVDERAEAWLDAPLTYRSLTVTRATTALVGPKKWIVGVTGHTKESGQRLAEWGDGDTIAEAMTAALDAWDVLKAKVSP